MNDMDSEEAKRETKSYFEKVKEEAEANDDENASEVAEQGIKAVENGKQVKALKKVKELASMGY